MKDMDMGFELNFKDLKGIEEKLIKWDLSVVEGGGEFIKQYNGGYGHVELKIRVGVRKEIIWSISETQLPNVNEIKEHVTNTIKTFHAHLEALRGENLKLVYQLTKSSYHAVDSHPLNYAKATIYAIINCFDKSYREFNTKKIMKRAATWSGN